MDHKITVTRDGVVMQDGENIGHVKKEIRQGIFATLVGASYSGGGTPYWVPFAADGTQLNEYGYDTRKRAVQRIEDHAEPMHVSRIEFKSSWLGGTKFVSATLRYQGHYFSVSRYASEKAWFVDCYSSPDSIMPVWSHGDGDRTVRKQALKGEAHEAVDRAAIDGGFWPIPNDGK
jgi:hypothetical protein